MEGSSSAPGEYALVVGAVNMDIGGIAQAPLVEADSNPGRVRMSLGGVGRNIAHNMALLGVDTRMITALGEDVYAASVAASCTGLGIDLSASVTVPGGATSTYLYIAGPEGDMALAVSDMEIYNALTPAVLAERSGVIGSAALAVVDANIPAETIAWLAAHAGVPLFADPVSTVKGEKLRPVLGRLHTLKPNALEAEALSGVRITDEKSLNAAADTLLATGLKRVFISLGTDGVLAADIVSRYRLPCLPCKAVNTTGGGDSFMAGLVWAAVRGLDLRRSALAGLAAASVAVEGRETINPLMREVLLEERMERYEKSILEDQ